MRNQEFIGIIAHGDTKATDKLIYVPKNINLFNFGVIKSLGFEPKVVWNILSNNIKDFNKILSIIVGDNDTRAFFGYNSGGSKIFNGSVQISSKDPYWNLGIFQSHGVSSRYTSPAYINNHISFANKKYGEKIINIAEDIDTDIDTILKQISKYIGAEVVVNVVLWSCRQTDAPSAYTSSSAFRTKILNSQSDNLMAMYITSVLGNDISIYTASNKDLNTLRILPNSIKQYLTICLNNQNIIDIKTDGLCYYLGTKKNIHGVLFTYPTSIYKTKSQIIYNLCADKLLININLRKILLYVLIDNARRTQDTLFIMPLETENILFLDAQIKLALDVGFKRLDLRGELGFLKSNFKSSNIIMINFVPKDFFYG
jgi:hypothetical protein